MEQKKLRNDLDSGKVERVYLLYGTEAWLREHFLGRIRQTLSKKPLEIQVFTDGRAHSIIAFAQTLTFFGEQKLAIAKDCGFFGDKKKTEAQALVDYLPKISQDTTLVFVETAADKRMKLFKTVDTMGAAVDCAAPAVDVLAKWLVRLAKDSEGVLSHRTAEQLVLTCGTDMFTLENELKKLTALCLDSEITPEHIWQISTHTTQARIFELTRAIVTRRASTALGIYYTLLAQKESPGTILFMISRQFMNMLYTAHARQQNMPTAQIAKATGMRDFMVREAFEHARKHSSESMIEVLHMCQKADSDIKQGRITGELAVEMLIARLVG